MYNLSDEWNTISVSKTLREDLILEICMTKAFCESSALLT